MYLLLTIRPITQVPKKKIATPQIETEMSIKVAKAPAGFFLWKDCRLIFIEIVDDSDSDSDHDGSVILAKEDDKESYEEVLQENDSDNENPKNEIPNPKQLSQSN